MNLFLYALGLSICLSACLSVTKMRTQKLDAHVNKCIGDDTKSAARQSLNCIKNKKIWRKTIFNMPDGILTPAMWHDHDIDFVRWLHPAVWHVALESWQWIHQVAAPCNVTRGCGMTGHWIRPNVRHIGILHMVSISTHHRSRHVILYQSAKFLSK